MNACSWGSKVPQSLSRTACALAALVLAWPVPASAQLNDTGQTQCYTTGNVATACSETSTGSTSGLPGQDGRYGRDAAQAAGALPPKTGGGAAGFDFTRICWNGAAEGSADCTGTLVANTTNTASTTPVTDWACTRDNVTGLVWSLQSRTASWNAAMVTTYPDAGHNTAARCGYSTGWRLPTRRELLSIVHSGVSSIPTIDTAYFPGTPSAAYWTQDTYVFSYPASSRAWYVAFDTGIPFVWDKTYTFRVQLVRSEQ